jgi:hypothetical protein
MTFVYLVDDWLIGKALAFTKTLGMMSLPLSRTSLEDDD